MQNAISMSGVCKSYEHFQLKNINIELPPGEIMGLVGVNGAGKSTTIRILLGLIQADAGSVNVLGHSLPQAQALAKAEIGYASEDMRLYKTKDLRWHMDFIQSIFPSWDENYAKKLLKSFDLKPEQKLKGFSHGQRVKASLLLLLARRSKLVILDEPTTGLDPVARQDVIEEMAEILRNEERSVLFSSHNTHDIEQLSDSITFLHDGEVVAAQDKESFLESWRMIRCRGDISDREIKLPNIAEVKSSGSVICITMNEFNDTSLNALTAQGLEIDEVLRMSLEEIFIANVKKGGAK